MRALVAAFVLWLCMCVPVRAQWRAALVARTGDADFSTSPLQVRVGQTVEVRVALRSPDGRVLADVPRLRWEGARSVRAGLPAGASIRWLRVVPRRYPYSNVIRSGMYEGMWRGLDTLEYDAKAFPDTPSSLRLENAEGKMNGGAGTIWLAAEITLADGTIVRTPDQSSLDRHGLRSDVLRLSFRSGDDFLGWLSSYFGVPFVFGSVRPQVDGYVAADCADVLIGAWRAMGRRSLRYVSVTGISRHANATSELLELGREGRVQTPERQPVELRWNRDVFVGDLVAIDYDPETPLTRRWDHIGVLVADDGDGVLDGDDILRHMMPEGLADRQLEEQGRIALRLWRWRWSAPLTP